MPYILVFIQIFSSDIWEIVFAPGGWMWQQLGSGAVKWIWCTSFIFKAFIHSTSWYTRAWDSLPFISCNRIVMNEWPSAVTYTGLLFSMDEWSGWAQNWPLLEAEWSTRGAKESNYKLLVSLQQTKNFVLPLISKVQVCFTEKGLREFSIKAHDCHLLDIL